MSQTTFILVRIFAPIFLVIGISMLLNPQQYHRVFKELQEFSLAYYLAAVVGLSIGVIMVLSHNLWNTLAESLVSLIGWGALLKGLIRLLLPQWSFTMIQRFATPTMLNWSAGLVIVWGGYMGWVGYIL